MLRIGGQRIPTRTLVVIISDAILILLGLVLAAQLRFHDDHLLAEHRHSGQVFRFGIVVVVCVVALYYNDLYNAQIIRRHSDLLLRLLQALGTAALILAVLYYFAPDEGMGRGVAALAAPVILIFLLGSRLLQDSTGFLVRAPERILVLGTGPAGISLVREIVARPELHLKVVGFLDERGENIGKSLVNPGIIGAASDVEAVAAKEKIDRVILSLVERRGKTPMHELLQLKFAGVQVEDAHAFNEKLTGRIALQNLSPSHLVLSDGFRKSALLLAAKRTIDVVASLLVLFICLPIMGLVTLAIWIETGRPVLFRQERVGLWGKPFTIFKFRSMVQDAEQNGPTWAANNDSRITRVGRFIRKFRLDELPQILNVFRGEMSLVGPRPERPYFCQLLEHDNPYYALRHSVRPGITGWAQVRYQYGASIEESKTKLEYDIFYIKHLSPILDVAILLETIKVMIYTRGAK